MIFSQLGISASEAIRMFYAQVTINHGIPFPVKIPNKETLAAFEETKHPEKLKSYNSFRELRDELGV